MPKIVFATRVGEEHLDALRSEYPGATFVAAGDTETQLRELPDADAVISWPLREALPVARRLRWVHCTSAGIERIRQLPELVEMEDVTLTNGRGAHAATIADHTFAFMLAFTRHLPALLEDKRARRWARAARSQGARELSGTVLGILGLGKIGAEIGAGLDEAPGLPLRHVPGWDCRPGRPGGRPGQRPAGRRRPGRHRPGAAPRRAPPWELPNVIISPHSSGASRQTNERGRQIMRENIGRFLTGQPLINVCDKRAGF